MRRALLACMLLLVPGAQAEVEGECRIIIGTEDLAGRSADDPDDAIALNASHVIGYTMLLPPETTAYRILLSLGPQERVVSEAALAPGTQPLNVTGNFSLASYSWVGSGLYRIRAEATSDDQSVCTAVALVHFQPGKVLTATMVAAGLAVAGGGAGVAASVVRALRESAEKVQAIRHFKRSLVGVSQLVKR